MQNLSPDTLAVLKNFSMINGNLLIKPGNVIKTSNEAGTTIAIATVPDTFEKEIAINDLSEFLNILNLFDRNPAIEVVDDKYIEISNGSTKSHYYLASKKILSKKILEFVDKDFNVSDPKVSFELSELNLGKLRKAASTFGFQNLSISSEDGMIVNGVVKDQFVSSSNSMVIELGRSTIKNSEPFDIVMGFTQLKFIPGDYVCNFYLSDTGSRIVEFNNKPVPDKKTDLRYFCGIDRNSTFGKV